MKKAYFCIDGFSFKRINDYYRYEHKRRSRLNLSALETYLRYEIERRLGWKSDSGNLTIEKHFYQPSASPQRIFYQNHAKEAILKFESKLANSGYAVHYAQAANMLKAKPNVNIFIDWVVANELRSFDIFILFSTQGLYANALRQMKLSKITNMLIGWNVSCINSSGENCRWKTDQNLIKNASIYCPLEKLLDQPNGKHPIVDIMFERFFNFRYQQSSDFGY